ncbi:MAG: Cof-type HAD-IIB family hydrolase [Bacilli bacterium]
MKINNSVIKYIFCDLDGTLLNDNKKISIKEINYIKKLKSEMNFKFGIATGRALSSVLPLSKNIGMDEIVDVYIINNGVETLNVSNDKIEKLEFISISEIKEIIEIFGKYDFINIGFHNDNCLFALRNSNRIQSVLKFNNKEILKSPFYSDFTETPRVMLFFDEADQKKVLNIAETIEFSNLRGILSEKNVYEFVNKDVSKAVAVNNYVQKYNDSLNNVLFFGDGENDLEMLSRAKISVAMKNGAEKAKSQAKYVTEFSNNEDGIYHFLKSNKIF